MTITSSAEPRKKRLLLQMISTVFIAVLAGCNFQSPETAVSQCQLDFLSHEGKQSRAVEDSDFLEKKIDYVRLCMRSRGFSSLPNPSLGAQISDIGKTYDDKYKSELQSRGLWTKSPNDMSVEEKNFVHETKTWVLEERSRRIRSAELVEVTSGRNWSRW